MNHPGVERAERKITAFAEPLLDTNERQLALLAYATQPVPHKWGLLIGPLSQLATKQYAIVVTDRRLLLIRRSLTGRVTLEAAYPRLSVTATYRKGLVWGGLTLGFPDRPQLTLRVHPIYGDAPLKVVAALPSDVGVTA